MTGLHGEKAMPITLSQINILDSYAKTKASIRCRIREVIEQVTINNTELVLFLMLSHKFLNEQNLSTEANSELESKLDLWHDEILSSCLNFKRSTYRHISDFKFNLGTLKGCDKLFFGLDKITESLRSSSLLEELLKDTKQLRSFLGDVATILDPEYKPETASKSEVALSLPKIGSKPQLVNIEVEVPKPLQQPQSEAENVQSMKGSASPQPKAKTHVKTIDASSLFGGSVQSGAKSVSSNTKAVLGSVENTVGNQENAGGSQESRPLKTYLHKGRAGTRGEEGAKTEVEEQPRSGAVLPTSNPGRTLFGMSFGPETETADNKDLRGRTGTPLSDADKENLKGQNSANSTLSALF